MSAQLGVVPLAELVRGDKVRATLPGTANVMEGEVANVSTGSLGGTAVTVIPEGSFYGHKLAHPYVVERLEAATS